MRVLAAITLVGFPQFAFAQVDLAKWNDWGGYQVVGILSSDSLLIIQESVYFVCDLESESESYSIQNCFAAVTNGQVVSMQADAARARKDAVANFATQQARVAARAAADAANAEAKALSDAANAESMAAANAANADLNAAMTLGLAALKDASDDQFSDAFKAALRANSCELELESLNLKNSQDLNYILVSLGTPKSLDQFVKADLETYSLLEITKSELKARSLAAMSRLLRDGQLEIGEFSKTVKLKDCQ